MISRVLSVSLISILASGCISSSDDEDCTGGKCDVDDVCTDPQYGDGVCQTQIDCAAPDIDCFQTFDTDADAAAWFAAFEIQLAMEEDRAPRKLLDESDRGGRRRARCSTTAGRRSRRGARSAI
jgi:hypothetical protein